MTAQTVEKQTTVHNPLDVLEEIVNANQWFFERASDDELIVEFEGRWSHYRMFFLWQREIGALQFSCALDMQVPESRRTEANMLLAKINNMLWFGHFEIGQHDQTPLFRHTVLLRGTGGICLEQLEDMVEISLTESERYYPTFQFVIRGGRPTTEAISASLLETAGEA